MEDTKDTLGIINQHNKSKRAAGVVITFYHILSLSPKIINYLWWMVQPNEFYLGCISK